jgi:hypothetical protein
VHDLPQRVQAWKIIAPVQAMPEGCLWRLRQRKNHSLQTWLCSQPAQGVQTLCGGHCGDQGVHQDQPAVFRKNEPGGRSLVQEGRKESRLPFRGQSQGRIVQEGCFQQDVGLLQLLHEVVRRSFDLLEAPGVDLCDYEHGPQDSYGQLSKRKHVICCLSLHVPAVLLLG